VLAVHTLNIDISVLMLLLLCDASVLTRFTHVLLGELFSEKGEKPRSMLVFFLRDQVKRDGDLRCKIGEQIVRKIFPGASSDSTHVHDPDRKRNEPPFAKGHRNQGNKLSQISRIDGTSVFSGRLPYVFQSQKM